MLGIIKPRGTPEWYVEDAERPTPSGGGSTQCALRLSNPACPTGLHRLGLEPDPAAGQHAPCVSGGRMSYVTGSHNVKFGYNARDRSRRPYGHHAQWRSPVTNFTAGRPSQVTVFNTPIDAPGIACSTIGVLRAGLVDAQAADDQPRRAHRMVLPRAWTRRCRCPGDSRRNGSSRRSAACIKWGPDYAPRGSRRCTTCSAAAARPSKTSFSKYHRQYDADPVLVYRRCGTSISENRNWFDVDRAECGRHACSGVAKPTDNEPASRRTTKSAPSPAGGTFGTVRNNKAWRISIASTTRSSRRACSTRSRRVSRVGVMLFKRQI